MSKRTKQKIKSPAPLPVAEDEQILYTAKVGRKIIGGLCRPRRFVAQATLAWQKV